MNLIFSSLRQYKPIRWKEQRRQYKTDFETEYPVYLRLKEKVDAVKIKFKELQEEYNGYKPGTPEHQVYFVIFFYFF